MSTEHHDRYETKLNKKENIFSPSNTAILALRPFHQELW